MTQLDRVIAASRRFNGVCQADFLGETVDGGPNITRVAARLQDAEDRGYTFECIGWRNKCKVFRLLSEPSELAPKRSSQLAPARQGHPPTPVTAPLSGELKLFEPPGVPHWRAA